MVKVIRILFSEIISHEIIDATLARLDESPVDVQKNLKLSKMGME